MNSASLQTLMKAVQIDNSDAFDRAESEITKGRDKLYQQDILSLFESCLKYGSQKCAQKLVVANPELLTLENSNGEGVLHLAARSGNLPISRILVTGGAPINKTDNLRMTPLFAAVNSGNMHIAEYLLDNGASCSRSDARGKYILHHYAAVTLDKVASGNVPQVAAMIIDEGCDIDCTDSNGKTPLIISAELGNTELCRLLMGRCAQMRLVDIDGRSALHHAIQRKNVDTTHLLLPKSDVNKTDRSGNSPLHYAVMSKHDELIQLMVDASADLNVVNQEGKTPLFIAVENKSIEVVELLIRAGARGDIPSRDLDLPTHIATRSGNDILLRTLLGDKNAALAVNNTNSLGLACLHIAAKDNNFSACDILCNSRADPNILYRDKCGADIYPLDMTTDHRCRNILRKRGAISVEDERPVFVQDLSNPSVESSSKRYNFSETNSSIEDSAFRNENEPGKEKSEDVPATKTFLSDLMQKPTLHSRSKTASSSRTTLRSSRSTVTKESSHSKHIFRDTDDNADHNMQKLATHSNASLQSKESNTKYRQKSPSETAVEGNKTGNSTHKKHRNITQRSPRVANMENTNDIRARCRHKEHESNRRRIQQSVYLYSGLIDIARSQYKRQQQRLHSARNHSVDTSKAERKIRNRPRSSHEPGRGARQDDQTTKCHKLDDGEEENIKHKYKQLRHDWESVQTLAEKSLQQARGVYNRLEKEGRYLERKKMQTVERASAPSTSKGRQRELLSPTFVSHGDCRSDNNSAKRTFRRSSESGRKSRSDNSTSTYMSFFPLNITIDK